MPAKWSKNRAKIQLGIQMGGQMGGQKSEKKMLKTPQKCSILPSKTPLNALKYVNENRIKYAISVSYSIF